MKNPRFIFFAVLFIAGIEAQGQWSLTGNTGSNPGTNFIGTTDLKDFIIRTNNIQ